MARYSRTLPGVTVSVNESGTIEISQHETFPTADPIYVIAESIPTLIQWLEEARRVATETDEEASTT